MHYPHTCMHAHVHYSFTSCSLHACLEVYMHEPLGWVGIKSTHNGTKELFKPIPSLRFSGLYIGIHATIGGSVLLGLPEQAMGRLHAGIEEVASYAGALQTETKNNISNSIINTLSPKLKFAVHDEACNTTKTLHEV